MQHLSNEKLRQLARLKQKKYRLAENLVLVEGQRTLTQLAQWGIKPQELYLVDASAALAEKNSYLLSPQAMQRICSSETAAGIAALYPLPKPVHQEFETAFYLEDLSDPGNLGTIFRTAAALNLEYLILSPGCCEISSPKVIRASLGAVYKVPFRYATAGELLRLPAKIYRLDMDGETEISAFKASGKTVIAIGNEAHGISPLLKENCPHSLRIGMVGQMESLNAAVCFAIAAYMLGSA